MLDKYLELNADDLREAYKRHSSPKEQGDIPLSEQDFERIPEYLDEFDGVLSVNTYNNKIEVHLYKKTEDGYMRILTVVSNERNSLQVTKLIGVSKEKFEQKYAKKIEGDIGSLWSLKEDSAPSTTAQHTADVPSTINISPLKEKVKSFSDFSVKEKNSLKGTVVKGELASLVKNYGAIPAGENPHRDVQVPKKTAKNKKVSQTVRTILEAKATPDEALPTIEKMVEDGVFSYDAYTDEKAIKDAEEHLKGNGWSQSFTEWMRDVEKGVVSKQHTVMGWALYNNAVNRATTTTSETERKTAMETALSVLDGMIKHQRSAAQALQATRVLKKLSSEVQLYSVQKSVQAFQKELIEKYKHKAPDLKINEKLAEQFLNAKTEDARLEAEKEIYQDIGRQMPSSFADKNLLEMSPFWYICETSCNFNKNVIFYIDKSCFGMYNIKVMYMRKLKKGGRYFAYKTSFDCNGAVLTQNRIYDR